jgi:hypothetical protein
MTCDEFQAAYLEGTEDNTTRIHLESCAECRARLTSLEAGRAVMADPAVWEEPSPELGDQMAMLLQGTTKLPEPTKWPTRTMAALGAVAAILLLVIAVVALRSDAPDWTVDIAGTDEAPLAAGTIEGWATPNGTRMVLNIDGLDPAPDGYIYELWLSQGPIHISAGTFTATDDVVVWSGVPRRDYPRLWITLEAIDEDESPSPTTVMDTQPG